MILSGLMKRVFCKCCMEMWDGYVCSVEFVAGLQVDQQPLSLTAHPGAIFTRLLQDGFAGR